MQSSAVQTDDRRDPQPAGRPRVVIVGSGFGGLELVHRLAGAAA